MHKLYTLPKYSFQVPYITICNKISRIMQSSTHTKQSTLYKAQSHKNIEARQSAALNIVGNLFSLQVHLRRLSHIGYHIKFSTSITKERLLLLEIYVE